MMSSSKEDGHRSSSFVSDLTRSSINSKGNGDCVEGLDLKEGTTRRYKTIKAIPSINYVTKSLYEVFKVSFLVSLKTLTLAICFGCIGLVPKLIVAWKTVVACDEGVCLTLEICKRRYENSMFGRFYCYSFEFGGFLDSFWLNMFLPCIVFTMYVRLSHLKWGVLVFIQGWVWLIQLAGIYMNPYYEVAKFFLFTKPLLYAMPAIIFKMFLPKDSLIPRMVMKAFLISILCAALVQFYDKLQALRMGFVLVVYPLFRISCFSISRTMAKQMAISKRVAGTGVKVRRNFAMLTTLFVQILISTWYRLVISAIDSTWEFAVFMVVSTLQEIGVRLTLPWQDWVCEHGFSHIKGCVHRRLSRAVVPNGEAQASNAQKNQQQQESRISNALSSKHDMMQTEEQWNASMIITEMITEQIGIVAAAGLVLIYKNRVLEAPLPIFLEKENPFTDYEFDLFEFALRNLSQLVGEILVDTICIMIETKKFNYPLEQAFSVLKTYGVLSFVISYILSTWTAIALAVMFIHAGTGGKIQTQPCFNTSVCSCGPSPDSLYGKYCSIYTH